MSYIQWGGKRWYRPKPQPRKPDINELMKPLSEKVGRGNIWGSVIMNVQKEGAPPIPTFEFTVDTTIAGSSGVGNFQLPLISSLPLNAVVDWGDGNTDTITTYNQAETLHTYSSAGSYTISITGDFSGWQFNNGGDKLKVGNISKWSGLNVSVSNAFYGCENMTCSATDAPTISSSTLFGMFRNCFNFNGAIGNWDVSGVSIMTNMFLACSLFNQDLNSWDVSNVTTMENMFNSCAVFNGNITSWDTSSCTRMVAMFQAAPRFNQAIGGWNVSNVTSMNSMFRNGSDFVQDISDWDVSNCGSFSNFFFAKSNYPPLLLDDIYNKWSALSLQYGVTANFGGSNYTAAGQPGRDDLTDVLTHGWTVTDGGVI